MVFIILGALSTAGLFCKTKQNKKKDPFDKPTHAHHQHSRTFRRKMQTSSAGLAAFVLALLIHLLQLFRLSTRLSVRVCSNCGHFGTPAFCPSGRRLVSSSFCFISCGSFHIRSRKTGRGKSRTRTEGLVSLKYVTAKRCSVLRMGLRAGRCC